MNLQFKNKKIYLSECIVIVIYFSLNAVFAEDSMTFRNTFFCLNNDILPYCNSSTHHNFYDVSPPRPEGLFYSQKDRVKYLNNLTVEQECQLSMLINGTLGIACTFMGPLLVKSAPNTKNRAVGWCVLGCGILFDILFVKSIVKYYRIKNPKKDNKPNVRPSHQ